MQRIGFVVSEGFQIVGIAAQAVFEFANRVAGEAPYEVHVLSEHGGLVRSSMGIALETERFSRVAFDTLIVLGTEDATPNTTPGLLKFVQRGLRESRRLTSICTGAFILAEAGVLDGRRATTHWFYSRTLQTSYPKVKVEEDRIFIVDGPVWTSAGATAGLDLALAMVEKDLGEDAARSVAGEAGDASSARGRTDRSIRNCCALSSKSDRIQNALSAFAGEESSAPHCRSINWLRSGQLTEPASVQAGSIPGGNREISRQGG